MKLSLIIVNYNTEPHIKSLLDNLSQQSYDSHHFEVIVVNNVQNDILTTVVRSYQDKLNITLVPSERNIGFGRAMNLGASHAVGQHLLITNPDIVMTDTQFLQDFAKQLAKQGDYGVMTCQLLNDDGEDKSEFVDFEFHATLGLDTSPRWLSGAFLALRADVYRQVGGFDPDFFMYCEDEDLCLRVQRLGYPLVKLNELNLYHAGGASEPIKSYDFFYRWFRSQILFAYKHFTQDEFTNLLNHLQHKSYKKYRHYTLLAHLTYARFSQKRNEWHAMYDVVSKTMTNGTDWLIFQ